MQLKHPLREDGPVQQFGHDAVFGQVFPADIPEWQRDLEEGYFHAFPCDASGWPEHGHLIWATPAWWTEVFHRHGLLRDTQIEKAIHDRFSDFYEKHSPSRKSFFVLKKKANTRNAREMVAKIESLSLTEGAVGDESLPGWRIQSV